MEAKALLCVSVLKSLAASLARKGLGRPSAHKAWLLSLGIVCCGFHASTSAASGQASTAQQLAKPPVQLQQQVEPEWLDLAQAELVYLQLEQGVVVLQLASPFAPRHAERFRQLVESGFYDGLSFYRVIDQFVLQAGLPDDEKHPNGHTRQWPALKAEFMWPSDTHPAKDFVLVQTDDIFAKETGFRAGFPVGRDAKEEWLLNCPNMVSMARNEAADSATTEIAIMQGQAPRHLDRNMSMVAKVVWGGEWLNLVKRGDKASGGMIADFSQRSLIVKARMGTQLSTTEQIPLQILNAKSRAFMDKLAAHRQRSSAFFHDKGNGKVDICYQQLTVRRKEAVKI